MSRENRTRNRLKRRSKMLTRVNSYLRSNISDSTPYAGDLGKPGHCNGVIIWAEGKRG